MINTRLETFKITLIGMLLLGTIATLIRSFLVIPSQLDKPILNSFDFPATIPLTGWQQIDKKSLKESQLYQYNGNRKTLNIQTSYRQYDGANVSRLLLIELESSIPPATVVMTTKQQNGIGYYGTFSYENRAYLTACINRVGKSTLTEEQYIQNKYKYGWSPQRTALWLLGQKDLFETGCLWTVISIPNTDANSLEQNYQTLETVFAEWYNLWEPKL